MDHMIVNKAYFGSMFFRWVYHEANKTTHVLAKQSENYGYFGSFSVDHCPPSIVSVVEKEATPDYGLYFFFLSFNKSFQFIKKKKEKKKHNSTLKKQTFENYISVYDVTY